MVLLLLDSRVGEVAHGNLDAQAVRCLCDRGGEIRDGVDPVKLVDHPVLTRGRRMLQQQPEAGHHVVQRQEAAALAAAAVDGKRLPEHGLAAEPVDGGTERLVKVQSGDQSGVAIMPVEPRSVHDPLHDIGGTQSP
jgi:hypothetical protein